MRSALRFMRMPLLWKELLEESGRKRTYITRVAYLALLSFLVSGYLYQDLPRGFLDSRALLGIGSLIFKFVMKVQFVTVYVLLPILMSGTIAGEKERGSLPLLLMTHMGPWRILLQKYLGVLILTFSFLLMGLPVLMVAFAFGGVSEQTILSGLYSLLLTSLFVGALCIMFSARSRSTLKALWDCYIIGGLLVGCIPWINGYWLYQELLKGEIEAVIFSTGVTAIGIWFRMCWPWLRARKQSEAN